jgi:hypothetical protein
MDPFHEQLARVALDAAGSFGFALAGGYAVQAHGFLNRMSADVDLFAEASGEFDFPEAVEAVIAAYQREGLIVQAEVLTKSFAVERLIRHCCDPRDFDPSSPASAAATSSTDESTTSAGAGRAMPSYSPWTTRHQQLTPSAAAAGLAFLDEFIEHLAHRCRIAAHDSRRRR